MFLTVEVAGKICHRFPFRELGRVRHIERSVGLEHVLVHHDVLRELAAGCSVVRKVGIPVHDGGKAIKFGRIRNLVTVVFQFRLFRGDSSCRSRETGKRKRHAKDESTL